MTKAEITVEEAEKRLEVIEDKDNGSIPEFIEKLKRELDIVKKLKIVDYNDANEVKRVNAIRVKLASFITKVEKAFKKKREAYNRAAKENIKHQKSITAPVDDVRKALLVQVNKAKKNLEMDERRPLLDNRKGMLSALQEIKVIVNDEDLLLMDDKEFLDFYKEHKATNQSAIDKRLSDEQIANEARLDAERKLKEAKLKAEQEKKEAAKRLKEQELRAEQEKKEQELRAKKAEEDRLKAEKIAAAKLKKQEEEAAAYRKEQELKDAKLKAAEEEKAKKQKEIKAALSKYLQSIKFNKETMMTVQEGEDIVVYTKSVELGRFNLKKDIK